MSQRFYKYTVIREYKNEFSIDELLKRLIHIHTDYKENIINKGCSDHKVNYEK